MRDLVFGCITVIVGMVLGGLLVLGALIILNSPGLTPSPSSDTLLLPNRPDLSISASARFVNSQMQQTLRQSGLTTEATAVLVAPNQLRITAPVTIPLLGKNVQVNATTTMTISVRNGRVVLSVDKVEAEGVNVPRDVWPPLVEAARAQGESELNHMVQQSLQGTGLHLAGIRITPDALNIDLSAS